MPDTTREEIIQRFRKLAAPLLEQNRDFWNAIQQTDDPARRKQTKTEYLRIFLPVWEMAVNGEDSQDRSTVQQKATVGCDQTGRGTPLIGKVKDANAKTSMYRGHLPNALKTNNKPPFSMNFANNIEKANKADILEREAFHALSDNLVERSLQLSNLLDRHCNRSSHWSGKTIIAPIIDMPMAMGRKEWSCDITLREDSEIKTAIHEHLHARSCSHYSPDIYFKWKSAEEGSVELLAQEICKCNQITYHKAYEPIVKQLRIANSILQEYENDYAFAKALFDIDLPERYNWLRNKADKLISTGKLKQKTVTALNTAIAALYGKEN